MCLSAYSCYGWHADPEALRNLSRVMLHLLVSLSAEPIFPVCDKVQVTTPVTPVAVTSRDISL